MLISNTLQFSEHDFTLAQLLHIDCYENSWKVLLWLLEYFSAAYIPEHLFPFIDK